MIWASSAQPGQPEYFSYDLIRKYVVTFGRIFSDIIIQRSTANNVITDFKVPLEYAAKDKTIVRLEGDPNLDRPFSALLPLMTFEIAEPGIAYDHDRKTTTLSKMAYRNPNDKNHLQVMYTPVPYNIYFNLYIYVKNQEDGAKILEQIFPFFQPDWSPTVELIPELNETRPVPIEMLPSMGYNDTYDKDFKVRRLILYTLSFRMRGWFFGPIRNKAMIKFTTLNLYAGESTNNQIAINYALSNGNLQTNTTIYCYNNNAITAQGTIMQASYMNTTSNTGSLVVSVSSGTFYQGNNFYTTGNSITAFANTIENGFYDSTGNFISTPLVAEYITTQPGLTNTGGPTNIVNNSVSWTLIDINDDYGFASTINKGEVP